MSQKINAAIAAGRQTAFDFGGHHQLSINHSKHNSGVAITTHVNDDARQTLSMKAFGLPYNQASDAVRELKGYADIFMAQNAVAPFKDLCASNITTLCAYWVDLDYTDVPELAHLTPDELIELVLKENPWLPLPTYGGSSGRNAYMVFALSKPLYVGKKAKNAAKNIGLWRFTMERLVRLLKNYGADKACVDPSRFLRLVGTTNSKNNGKVTAKTYGNPISFTQMHVSVTEYLKTQRTTKPKNSHSKNFKAKHTNNIASLKNFYSLAWCRMQEMQTLAAHHVEQTGKLSKNRWQWLFCYSVEASRFCKSEHSIKNELWQFCTSYFDLSDEKYTEANILARVVSTMTRFKESRTANGGFVGICDDTRYKFRGSTLAERLGVSEELYYQLKLDKIRPAEIAKKVKLEKQTQTRRKKGQGPRPEYLGRAADRKRRAIELRTAGMKIKDIVATLDVSESSVKKYIKNVKPGKRCKV